MRKALTLRALPAALSIAILVPGAVLAQEQGTRDMPPTAAPDTAPAPPPGEMKKARKPHAGDGATASQPAPAPTDVPPSSAAPAGDAAAPAATIVDIAIGNAPLSTLVTAVKAADLVTTLSGPGPFTVFAPTNDAFAKLPPGTVDTLVKPENKTRLANLLTYHVVAGTVSASDLAAQIKAGGGTAALTTVQGGTLTATLDGDAIVLTDAKGGKARVIVKDVRASNGIVHAIDTVVMP